MPPAGAAIQAKTGLSMVRHGRNRPLKHLGTLRGVGALSIHGQREPLGPIEFEIDGFRDRDVRSASGQIEGDAAILAAAFVAGAASIGLDGGISIDVVLADPVGGSVTEIKVTGPFPL